MTERIEIVFATRGSKLAVAQSQMVADQLMARCPDIGVTLKVFSTQGDEILDRPLRQVGGKGLFTKSIERALLEGQADVAIHSLKDMETQPPHGLAVAAFPARADVADVVVTRDGRAWQDLPDAAAIATGGLRRVAQLAGFFPNATAMPIRGNINSRLEKLDRGDFDAILLAAAGLERGGLAQRIGQGALPPQQFIPAPGQGALAVQMAQEHPLLQRIAQALDCATTRSCVTAERAFLAALDGSCHTPIAAWAEPADRQLTLRGFVAPMHADENTIPRIDAAAPVWRGQLSGELAAAKHLGQALAKKVRQEAAFLAGAA